MQKKVYLYKMSNQVVCATELEELLNAGWKIERCDSPFTASTYGNLIYVLYK